LKLRIHAEKYDEKRSATFLNPAVREDPVLSPGTKLGQLEIMGHVGSGGIRPLDKDGARV